MSPNRPLELYQSLRERWPCRDLQIQQLLALLKPSLPSPPTIVVHGLEATGKSSLVTEMLVSLKLQHAIINSREIITQRHFLNKTLSSCVAAVEKGTAAETEDLGILDSRCDHVNTLGIKLGKVLSRCEGKFVLVIDGIDRQREVSGTLMPALASIGSMVSNLTILMVVRSTRPLNLQKQGIPHVYFPPYTRAEAIPIVARKPPAALTSFPTDLTEAYSKWYLLFTTAIYDSLIAPTSHSLPQLQDICLRLWPKFIAPVLQHDDLGSTTPSNRTRTNWDFPKLFLKNRSLFQAEGEALLVDRIIDSDPEVESRPQVQTSSNAEASIPRSKAPNPGLSKEPLLKYTTTVILLAAYLASHTPPKQDIVLFSRLSTTSSRSRRARKSQHRIATTPSRSSSAANMTMTTTNGTDSTSTTPSKKKSTPNATGTTLANGNTNTPSSRKSTWSHLTVSGIPHPFPLDRLIAIYRAIDPDHPISSSSTHPSLIDISNGVRKPKKHKSTSDTLYASLAELRRLRLVIPISSAAGFRLGSGGGGGDEGYYGGGGAGNNEEEKWRVNVRRGVVEDCCREWRIGYDNDNDNEYAVGGGGGGGGASSSTSGGRGGRGPIGEWEF